MIRFRYFTFRDPEILFRSRNMICLDLNNYLVDVRLF